MIKISAHLSMRGVVAELEAGDSDMTIRKEDTKIK